MNINCKKTKRDTLVTIEGDITIYTAGEFKTQLLSHLGKPGDVEVELSQVSELDSSGVQVFILAKREALQRGCNLRLVGHSAAIVDIFELYNLGSYFGDPVLMSIANEKSENPDSRSAN